MEPDDNPGEDASAFVTRRNKQLAALDPSAARAAANQAFKQSIRIGQALSLPRPQDVLAYGARRAASATIPSKPAHSGAAAPASIGTKAWDAVLEANAVARAASNAITFGGADNVEAAGDALFQPGGLSNWGQRYSANLQHEKAQDRYDMIHRPVAQAIGNVGGGVLGLFAFGPEEAAAAAAPRLAGAMKLTARKPPESRAAVVWPASDGRPYPISRPVITPRSEIRLDRWSVEWPEPPLCQSSDRRRLAQ